MKKLITMSLLALGSLTMFAGEKPSTIELEKTDQFVKCYYFEFYKQEFKNGVPLYANYLIEDEYSKHFSEAAAYQRFLELGANYNTNMDSNFTGVVYMGAYREALSSECPIIIGM